MALFTKKDVGCYFDGCRGIYIGELVQDMAVAYGWRESKASIDSEEYHDATDEATDYLNTLTSDDVYFGWNNGDYGLYPIEDND